MLAVAAAPHRVSGAGSGAGFPARGAVRPAAAAMNFSEVFKLSSQLCKFSPDGKYLVSGRGAWAAGGACPPRVAGTRESGSRAAAGVARSGGARASEGAGPGQVLGVPGR